jgi:DHA3 family macrolide efflux protein-like MFS transporter
MRTFFIVLIGQTLSQLGSNLTEFSLSVWIFQKTGSPVQFALGILSSAVPRIVLLPLIGALVDRWNRKTIMILADSLLALRTVAVLLLLTFGSLSILQIYILNAIASLFGGFHSLAWSASRTLLIPKKHLARVNGLSSSLSSASSLLSPALAGALFVTIGMRGIVTVDLISWSFAIVPLFFVTIPRLSSNAAVPETSRLADEIKDGWRYLKSMPGLLRLLAFYSTIGFVGITTEVLLAPYILSFGNAAHYGIVQSGASLGFLVGGFLLALLGNPAKVIWIIITLETLICFCGALVGVFPVLWVVSLLVFIYFATVAFCDGTIMTLWQRKIRPELQGRVFALKDTLTTALMPIGVMVFSPIAEFWFEPNLQVGGAWASGIGRILGVGPGRGIGFLFLASNVLCIPIVIMALVSRRLRRVDTDIPDHS